MLTNKSLELLTREHHLRTPYVQPSIFERVKVELIDDVAKLVAEYVSPALSPEQAMKCSEELKNTAMKDNWSKIEQRDSINAISSYLLGVACTNPVKLKNAGIDVSEDVELMKTNILKWINEVSIDLKQGRHLLWYQLVCKIGEPMLIEDFWSYGSKYLIIVSDDFLRGRIRFVVNYSHATSIPALNEHDLENDIKNGSKFFGEINKEELEAWFNSKHYGFHISRGIQVTSVDIYAINENATKHNVYCVNLRRDDQGAVGQPGPCGVGCIGIGTGDHSQCHMRTGGHVGPGPDGPTGSQGCTGPYDKLKIKALARARRFKRSKLNKIYKQQYRGR